MISLNSWNAFPMNPDRKITVSDIAGRWIISVLRNQLHWSDLFHDKFSFSSVTSLHSSRWNGAQNYVWSAQIVIRRAHTGNNKRILLPNLHVTGPSLGILHIKNTLNNHYNQIFSVKEDIRIHPFLFIQTNVGNCCQNLERLFKYTINFQQKFVLYQANSSAGTHQICNNAS